MTLERNGEKEKKRDDHKHITCSQPIPHTMGELAAALINKKKKKKKKKVEGSAPHFKNIKRHKVEHPSMDAEPTPTSYSAQELCNSQPTRPSHRLIPYDEPLKIGKLSSLFSLYISIE